MQAKHFFKLSLQQSSSFRYFCPSSLRGSLNNKTYIKFLSFYIIIFIIIVPLASLIIILLLGIAKSIKLKPTNLPIFLYLSLRYDETKIWRIFLAFPLFIGHHHRCIILPISLRNIKLVLIEFIFYKLSEDSTTSTVISS